MCSREKGNRKKTRTKMKELQHQPRSTPPVTGSTSSLSLSLPFSIHRRSVVHSRALAVVVTAIAASHRRRRTIITTVCSLSLFLSLSLSLALQHFSLTVVFSLSFSHYVFVFFLVCLFVFVLLNNTTNGFFIFYFISF